MTNHSTKSRSDPQGSEITCCFYKVAVFAGAVSLAMAVPILIPAPVPVPLPDPVPDHTVALAEYLAAMAGSSNSGGEGSSALGGGLGVRLILMMSGGLVGMMMLEGMTLSRLFDGHSLTAARMNSCSLQLWTRAARLAS